MARVLSATLCVREGCALPRRHRDGCDNQENLKDEGCGGCLPALAQDGLKLCMLHTERLGEDAVLCARLHTDLELQLRRSGRGEYTSGSRDKSNMPDETVMNARRQLHVLLAGMVELMVFERGLSVPGLKVSSRPTRDLVTAEQVTARLKVDGVGGAGEIGTARQTASEVEVMAALIVRHAEWFAARDDAGAHSKALHDLGCRTKDDLSRGQVWSLAYPSRSKDFQEIGTCPLAVTAYAVDGSTSEETCGGRVYWYPEQSALAYCDLCDQAETVEWWQREIVGVPDAVLDTVAAAAWLSDKWRRPVMPSQIANWASRGKLPRLTEAVMENEKSVEKPVKDSRGRQLYRLTDLEECATRTFKQPPPAASARGKTMERVAA